MHLFENGAADPRPSGGHAPLGYNLADFPTSEVANSPFSRRKASKKF